MFADDTNSMKTILSLNKIKDELIPGPHKGLYDWLKCTKLSLQDGRAFCYCAASNIALYTSSSDS